MCQFLLKHKLPKKPEAFIDSFKRSESHTGIPIIHPDEVQDWSQYFIIVAVTKDEEIREKLLF